MKNDAFTHVRDNIFGDLEVNQDWSSCKNIFDGALVGPVDFFFNAQLQLKEIEAQFLYVINNWRVLSFRSV